MTDARQQAMERLLDEARLIVSLGLVPFDGGLARAVQALNALPAPQPAGEVVEVRGCVGVDGNNYYAYGEKGEADDALQSVVASAGYEPLCMFTLQVPAKAPLPTIPATVTQGGGA